LSGTVQRRASALIEPLRDLFAALFFVLFGLQVDISSLPPVLVAASLLALVTAATKVVTGWYAARRLGVGVRGRARAGAALIARGEFSIVIAGLAIGSTLDRKLAPLAAAYVLLLAIAGPILRASPTARAGSVASRGSPVACRTPTRPTRTERREAEMGELLPHSGRTGLEVTKLGYGAMELRGGDRAVATSTPAPREILNAVLGAGINFIDTSPDYGVSEELIGEHISGRRDEYSSPASAVPGEPTAAGLR
jgi:hypothetical protein